MRSQSNVIQEAVWAREVENGIRHVTLRRNFTEETVIRQEGEETQFVYEETNVYIPDRDNIHEFVANNFGNLFDLGLEKENAPTPKTDIEINAERISAAENAILELMMIV